MYLDWIHYQQINLAPSGSGSTPSSSWEIASDQALDVSFYNFATIQIEIEANVISTTFGPSELPVSIGFEVLESNDKINFIQLTDSTYEFEPTATGLYRATKIIMIKDFSRYIKPKFYTGTFAGIFNVFSSIQFKNK